jgi:hypothetical protein
MRSKKTVARDIGRCNEVDWETVIIPTQSKPCGYLRLQPGDTYVLRLFANPKRIYRFYLNGRSAITDDPEDPSVTLDGYQFRPHARYAQLVLDRTCGSVVKIVEFSEPVFWQIAKLCQQRATNAGGCLASDVRIEVVGGGINTRYRVDWAGDPNRFTEDEKQRIRTAIESGYDLDAIFKPTPNIKEFLLGNR